MKQYTNKKRWKSRIYELNDFILLEEKSIIEKKTQSVLKKAKIKTQTKEILAVQKSVLKNASRLHHGITDIINAFVNKSIFLGNLEADVYYTSESLFE